MNKLIIITLSTTFFLVDVIAGWKVEYPFTNMLETVYINNGKHLLRVDSRQKEEFVIAEGTETIGEFAFDACFDIPSVIIPDSVTNIMVGAFAGCRSLTNVVFGTGLREIGEKAFLNCQKLKRVELPDSLETVGSGVFWLHTLREVKIGSGLRNVDSHAFYVDNLPSFTVSPSNQWLRVENGKIVRKNENEVQSTVNP